jgi:hypothetical protein
VADFEEVDIGLKIKDTEVGNIRAEMELEALVSRFRADVDKASSVRCESFVSILLEVC